MESTGTLEDLRIMRKQEDFKRSSDELTVIADERQLSPAEEIRRHYRNLPASLRSQIYSELVSETYGPDYE